VKQAIDEGPSDHSAIGWPRAIVTALVVFVVGIGVGVIGANAVLTNLTGVTRDVRIWIATALMLVTIFGLAWSLRRLQARGLI